MGDRRTNGWNMGKIYPTTNLSWNNGVVSSGGNSIRISKVQLTKDTTITLTTRDAIAQIMNSKGMVVSDSHDSYNSTITVTLKQGIYS
jgi:hypothetical protein